MDKVLRVAPVMGLLLTVFSAAYVAPIITSLLYHDEALARFAAALAVNLGAGLALWLATRRFQGDLRPADGYLLVVLAWAGTASLATVPLLLVVKGLSFTDAYFETMSGLTTTGATVLTGLDSLPESINLWRHLLNWLGGMGIIVLAVAILPLLGVGGRQLYRAEMPGPVKETGLAPRITEAAKKLWYVYAGLTAVCIVALWLAGMTSFDAICHAFAAMSLGGFSTHDASIGFFDSALIEMVLIVFMLLAAMNFATHFLAWRDKSLNPYRRDPEAPAVLVLILASCAAISWFLWSTGTYTEFWTALRHASFNLVSIATDCGFVSVDYGQWPVFAPLWMLFLSCVAASSGSTGGGMKMIRLLILCRQSLREMGSLLHPYAMYPLKVGATAVPDSVIFSVLGFITLYTLSIIVLTLLLVASGLDFISSFSAIIACINNAGPGLNEVGPATNFGGLSDFQTWICTTAMLLGRLELFTLLVLFTRTFWRR
jgi:trk system potassium uptake protein TrkH